MQLKIHKFFSQNLVLLVHSNLTADITLTYENVYDVMHCIEMKYNSKHKNDQKWVCPYGSYALMIATNCKFNVYIHNYS